MCGLTCRWFRDWIRHPGQALNVCVYTVVVDTRGKRRIWFIRSLACYHRLCVLLIVLTSVATGIHGVPDNPDVTSLVATHAPVQYILVIVFLRREKTSYSDHLACTCPNRSRRPPTRNLTLAPVLEVFAAMRCWCCRPSDRVPTAVDNSVSSQKSLWVSTDTSLANPSL